MKQKIDNFLLKLDYSVVNCETLFKPSCLNLISLYFCRNITILMKVVSSTKYILYGTENYTECRSFSD